MNSQQTILHAHLSFFFKAYEHDYTWFIKILWGFIYVISLIKSRNNYINIQHMSNIFFFFFCFLLLLLFFLTIASFLSFILIMPKCDWNIYQLFSVWMLPGWLLKNKFWLQIFITGLKEFVASIGEWHPTCWKIFQLLQ